MATAREQCDKLRQAYPGHRFAPSKKGDAVGVWDEASGRFVEVLLKTITDSHPWVWLADETGRIHTMICDGKPLYGPDDWEVDDGKGDVGGPVPEGGSGDRA
jgi:hypothetical protein